MSNHHEIKWRSCPCTERPPHATPTHRLRQTDLLPVRAAAQKAGQPNSFAASYLKAMKKPMGKSPRNPRCFSAGSTAPRRHAQDFLLSQEQEALRKRRPWNRNPRELCPALRRSSMACRATTVRPSVVWYHTVRSAWYLVARDLPLCGGRAEVPQAGGPDSIIRSEAQRFVGNKMPPARWPKMRKKPEPQPDVPGPLTGTWRPCVAR